jgi:rod shape-determining protein MreC
MRWVSVVLDAIRGRKEFTYAMTAVAALLLMTIDTAAGWVHPKNALFFFVYPFQYAFRSATRTVSQLGAGISELRELREELRLTRKRIGQLEDASVDYEEMRRENARLREKLGERELLGSGVVFASVVGRDPENLCGTLVIDRGTRSGVAVNMPVVAYQDGEKGVVGKISEAMAFASKVLPVVDENCRIGGILQDTRFNGLVVGQGVLSERCTLRFLSPEAKVRFGDRVVTSGLGGVFPKGLLVGTVQDRESKSFGLFLEIEIKPVVDFARIEDVFVIQRSVPPDLESLLGDE